jgi:hypothetical protein
MLHLRNLFKDLCSSRSRSADLDESVVWQSEPTHGTEIFQIYRYCDIYFAYCLPLEPIIPS